MNISSSSSIIIFICVVILCVVIVIVSISITIHIISIINVIDDITNDINSKIVIDDVIIIEGVAGAHVRQQLQPAAGQINIKLNDSNSNI